MKIIFFSFVLILFTQCDSPNKMNKESTTDSVAQVSFDNIDKQGHRGCRGLLPENSLPAMLRALQLGVNTLEMDISFTKDKQVILSHEPFFNHEITTKPDGRFVEEADEKSLNIYQMNFAEVEKFDVGMKPHPRFPQQQKMKVAKPLLKNLIDSVVVYCQKNKLILPYFNIETKTKPETDNIFHPAPKEFVDLLVRILEEKKIADHCIIQSFDVRTLQYLHATYPQFQTALLIEDFDKRSIEEQMKTLGFIPSIYSPHFSLVNDAVMNYCKQNNVKVIPWTVNDLKEMKRLVQLGVAGIISDYPNLFFENSKD
jgi:glycerophosphoryl diester phosphodiesterase